MLRRCRIDLKVEPEEANGVIEDGQNGVWAWVRGESACECADFIVRYLEGHQLEVESMNLRIEAPLTQRTLTRLMREWARISRKICRPNRRRARK